MPGRRVIGAARGTPGWTRRPSVRARRLSALGGTVAIVMTLLGGPHLALGAPVQQGPTTSTAGNRTAILPAPAGPVTPAAAAPCAGTCMSPVVAAAANSPVLATTASPGTALINNTVRDIAVLTGAVAPTGTVTFRLFSDGACTAQVFSSTNGIIPDVVPGLFRSTSDPFTLRGAGVYHWMATFSGDANNNPAGPGLCLDPLEQVVVTKNHPTIATFADPRNATVGQQVRDTAQVSFGFATTGTVTFRLYSDASCTAEAFNSTMPLDPVALTSASAPFTVGAPGTYHWLAVYNGDLNNEASEPPSCSNLNEQVVVTGTGPPSSTSTSTSSPTSSTTTSSSSSSTSTSSTSTSTSTTSTSSSVPTGTSSSSTSSTSSTSPSSSTSSTSTSTTAPGSTSTTSAPGPTSTTRATTTTTTTSPTSSTTTTTTTTSPTSTTTTTAGTSTSTTGPGSTSSTTVSPTTPTTRAPTTVPTTAPPPPVTPPGVSITPQVARPGDPLTVVGQGFPARQPVLVQAFSSPIFLASTRADARGNFRVVVRVPAGLAVGAHTIVATGPGGVPRATAPLTVPALTGAGQLSTLILRPLSVTGPSPVPVGATPVTGGTPLARTGAAPAGAVRLAMTLIALGAAMVAGAWTSSLWPAAVPGRRRPPLRRRRRGWR